MQDLRPVTNEVNLSTKNALQKQKTWTWTKYRKGSAVFHPKTNSILLFRALDHCAIMSSQSNQCYNNWTHKNSGKIKII